MSSVTVHPRRSTLLTAAIPALFFLFVATAVGTIPVARTGSVVGLAACFVALLGVAVALVAVVLLAARATVESVEDVSVWWPQFERDLWAHIDGSDQLERPQD